MQMCISGSWLHECDLIYWRIEQFKDFPGIDLIQIQLISAGIQAVHVSACITKPGKALLAIQNEFSPMLYVTI